jgi:hypothetical protein
LQIQQDLSLAELAAIVSDALTKAIMVAKRHPIDFQKVKSWSRKEKHQQKYQDFLDSLEN